MSRAARKTRKFFLTRHGSSQRPLQPVSYSSPCTSLLTLVPVTPLALQLRRRPSGKSGEPLAMNANQFANYQQKYNDKDNAGNMEAAGLHVSYMYLLPACMCALGRVKFSFYFILL